MTSKDAPAPPPIPAKASRLPPGPPSIASPGIPGDGLAMSCSHSSLFNTESSLKVTGAGGRHLPLPPPPPPSRHPGLAGAVAIAKSLVPRSDTRASPIRATPGKPRRPTLPTPSAGPNRCRPALRGSAQYVSMPVRVRSFLRAGAAHARLTSDQLAADEIFWRAREHQTGGRGLA